MKHYPLLEFKIITDPIAMLATTPSPRSNKRSPPSAVNQADSRHRETGGRRKVVSPRKQTNQPTKSPRD